MIYAEWWRGKNTTPVMRKGGHKPTRKEEKMKAIFNTYETEKEAAEVVKALMADGYSAYRQGKTVYIDDGGIDDAI